MKFGAAIFPTDYGISMNELAPAVEMVHPFDLEQTAAALATAVDISSDERAPRATHLRALAGARSPQGWLDDLLTHLEP